MAIDAAAAESDDDMDADVDDEGAEVESPEDVAPKAKAKVKGVAKHKVCVCMFVCVFPRILPSRHLLVAARRQVALLVAACRSDACSVSPTVCLVWEVETHCQATAKSTSRMMPHVPDEGEMDGEPFDSDDEDDQEAAEAPPVPTAKGKAKAMGKAKPKARPSIATPQPKAMARDGNALEQPRPSQGPMSLFNGGAEEMFGRQVMCESCGRLCDFRSVRLASKGDAKFKCLNCGTTTTQLRRHFGSWPVDGWSLLSKVCS
jgi:hypothetical protein